jgi:predicted nuclease of restriction endonuclease-like (RecB) superfamily
LLIIDASGMICLQYTLSPQRFAMNYPVLLKEITDRIRQGQLRASMAVNAELLALYWDIGKIIAERRSEEGWGTKVIQRLAKDLHNNLSEAKGFSERNLRRMLTFYNEYRELSIWSPMASRLTAASSNEAFVPPAVAKLSQHTENTAIYGLVLRLPWAHNVILLRIKDRKVRKWYMEHTLEYGWSKDRLEAQIKDDLYRRQGKAATNFCLRLPSQQSALAQESLKDPYKFDFLTLEEPFHERELENGLVCHLEKFLLELGAGFAFVGRQYHLAVSEHDFYIDILFYHMKLRCYVVIELKTGEFKPEYAGKLTFYCSAVDDTLRHEQDNPTIGLILCQHKDKVLAEYTLRRIDTPIGVSEYQLTRALPENLQSNLPTVEEIEARLEETGIETDE